ncbi:PP2C family protein-serine/threonine phosphatase [Urechidicola vernalis]|uniref:SpoIIE family protein phosphatase n=1 Tax=Urechidicola vernalis TaxID=3075600 RepID=A0ABU2Y1L4_9FLAO|nr:SpoIIE family protein phosphatase [Urechidicola sp. P050]MDT0552099.1 SpoIIE family protein phosphatase [Urechidicola sp. P050]
MSSEKLNRIISKLDQHLNIGIAITNLDNFNIEYENELFSNWIEHSKSSNNLSDRISNLKIDRVLKRCSKGRNYEHGIELSDGGRNTSLKIQIAPILEDNSNLAIVKVVDNTKFKELEYMMDSYAKLAESNKRDLERALRVIKKQNERMKNELEIARQVQMGMLPFNFDPGNKNVEFAALLKPAKEVGGDFFDIFYLNENELCVCLGDVSDKGAGSALFMAATKTLIKFHAFKTKNVAEIVNRVNNELTQNNTKCMFATLFIGIFNINSGLMSYTNCGHCYPLVISKDKGIEKLTSLNGPAIGIIEKLDFSEQEVKLKEFQSLLVYSDGVTESSNKYDEFFGDQRLNDSIKGLKEETSPQDIVNIVFNNVVNFEKGTDQADDITIVGLKYLGK